MEGTIRQRAYLLQFIALVVMIVLMWGYAQLEWGMPHTVKKSVVQQRGTIVAADSSVLARSVDGKRVYPQGMLAGQIVGMMGATEGLEGIEKAYDASLAAGQTVQLTIDPKTQASAELALSEGIKKHEGKYGSVIVMETRTGRILAAASYPPFDPNEWRKFSPEERRNRPFLDVYEPGSVIKALSVAAAMNEGLTTPKTEYSTPMERTVGDKKGRSLIHDAVDHPPRLSTKYILRYSSNVGMSHIVEKFDPPLMRQYLVNYGLGRSLQMPALPSETGRLQDVRRWNPLVRATTSFGQGMSSTTLQLAAAFNTIANDGLFVTPRLVEGEAAGEKREVLRPQVARETREMLQAVIDEGISKTAGLDGYALAGKTGTAQVSLGAKGYAQDLYDSTFAGFFPAEQPRATVVVMVHGAKRDYHGSMLAAPIYQKVAAALISQWGAAPEIRSYN